MTQAPSADFAWRSSPGGLEISHPKEDMGSLLRARDPAPLHGQVDPVACTAIQALTAADGSVEQGRRLRDALERVWAVHHPRLLTPRGWWVSSEGCAWQTEIPDGVDLGAVLRALKQRGVRLPVELVVGIARAVLEGLAALHQQGIAHGGLAPEKIVVGFDGSVRVLSAGLVDAAVLAGWSRPVSLFRAPEERFSPSSTPASDVYAVALITWQLLVGPVADVSDASGAPGGWPLAHRLVPGVAPELSRLVGSILQGVADEPEDARGFISALRPYGGPLEAQPLRQVLRWLFRPEELPPRAAPQGGARHREPQHREPQHRAPQHREGTERSGPPSRPAERYPSPGAVVLLVLGIACLLHVLTASPPSTADPGAVPEPPRAVSIAPSTLAGAPGSRIEAVPGR